MMPRPPRPRRLELSIAWRYLRSGGSTRVMSFASLIAVGGVVVGVSALIVVIGVMAGLQGDLREKIRIASPDVRVLVSGGNARIGDWPAVRRKIQAVPGVVAVEPVVMTDGILTAGHQYTDGVQVIGIEPERRGAAEATSIRQHAKRGDFRFASTDGAHHGVVLGALVAGRFGALTGDTLSLLTLAGGQIDRATGYPVHHTAALEVTGIVETGMYDYDNRSIYVALDLAQEMAGLGGAVTALDVRTRDQWRAAAVAAAIDSVLGTPYRALDWRAQNRSLFQALTLEKLGMGVIVLLIVVVAAFNIVSNLVILVGYKTREIGILRTMGMTARSIRNIFFAQGIAVGVLGTTGGLLLGLGVSTAIGRYKLIRLDPQTYFIDHLPVTIQAGDVATIVAASLLVAALATLYPSLQAARLYPIDAIRKE